MRSNAESVGVVATAATEAEAAAEAAMETAGVHRPRHSTAGGERCADALFPCSYAHSLKRQD